MGQNRVKMAFSLTPDRQNDKIDFAIGKVVKMTKIWGPGHGFVRLWAGPSAQRQLVRGLAAASLQDPQKGSKMVKIRSNLGSLRVPPRSIRTVGLNRHILARGQRFGSGGLKMGQNRVKMAFSLTPDRQNDKNWLFFNRKSGQNDQNLRSQGMGQPKGSSASRAPKGVPNGPSSSSPGGC